MIMMYKILHGLDRILFDDQLVTLTLLQDQVVKNPTRALILPPIKLQETFLFQVDVINNWNSLPQEINESVNVRIIKSKLGTRQIFIYLVKFYDLVL